MKNRLLYHVSSTMTNIGINVLRDDAQAHKTWRIIFIYVMLALTVVSLIMVSITSYDDFNTFVLPAPYIAASTVMLCGIQVTFYYKAKIGEMLQLLDTGLYQYPDEHLLQVPYKWYLQEDNTFMMLKLLIYGAIFFLTMISAPGFAELVYYRRIKTFIYPCWTPWRMDNLKIELFTFLIHNVQAICSLVFNYAGAIFLIVVLVEFVKQYERLGVAIRSLEFRTKMLVSRYPKFNQAQQYDRVMRENIVHCIRHHQILYQCFQSFQLWFTAFFSMELAICLLTFALALYVAMNGSNLAEFWNFFTILLYIWTNFLTRCLVSEVFTSLNDNLADTIFWEMSWVEVNKPNRRLFLLFHQTAYRLLRLYGLSVFEANRRTLTTMIRITYSMFNALRVSRN